ncbi:MAG: transposase [Myxococcota bacterium]
MSGVDLHAGVVVGKKRRDRNEEICRSLLLRPPLAADRLSWAGDGDVLVRLKTPWSDGTSHVKLTPVELLGRLAVLIPKPNGPGRLHRRALRPPPLARPRGPRGP